MCFYNLKQPLTLVYPPYEGYRRPLWSDCRPADNRFLPPLRERLGQGLFALLHKSSGLGHQITKVYISIMIAVEEGIEDGITAGV